MDYKDKIRKLLALAKSPEPEEAKLALLKARKLMAEHKLTERDLDEHDTTVIQQEIDETFSKKANSWMAPLSSIIGENYCCAAYRCKRGAKTTVWHVGFIGLKDDFEICVKIYSGMRSGALNRSRRSSANSTGTITHRRRLQKSVIPTAMGSPEAYTRRSQDRMRKTKNTALC
jgi:hypothetical protein